MSNVDVADGHGGNEPPAVEWMILHHLAIILLTIIGNTLLIYVILKNNVVRRRKRITPVQMLMLHMCAADLLFALITMVPTMAMTATVPVFHGPNVLCKFVKFLQVIPMYASSFLLVAISADRFQAICRPLASMKSNAYKRPALYASAAWALALLFSTPQFALFAKRDGDCVGTYTNPYQYAIYVIVFNTVVWLLPSAIAGYLYYQVCRAVWQSTSFGSAFSPSERKTAQCVSSFGMQAHHKVRRIGSTSNSDGEVDAYHRCWQLHSLGAILHHVCNRCSLADSHKSNFRHIYHVLRQPEQCRESVDLVLLQSSADQASNTVLFVDGSASVWSTKPRWHHRLLQRVSSRHRVFQGLKWLCSGAVETAELRSRRVDLSHYLDFYGDYKV
ncbi:hypothetical protein Q1695_008447 [Nippostrongylus brasiliensis]|nr:hypothetical protein Q1695_008447 [Nippostrongylus brasiliensis]